MCGLKQSSEPLSQNSKRLCSNKLKNGFENTQVFADDGYSGVNFERPAFRRMLHLIEDGNELAPFKNLFNEWFARDTSKKIRAVKRAKAEKGERIGSRPPYGYVKDPNNKNHIIVDEETAPVVQKIFSMCVAGLGPTMIANRLKEMQVLTPVLYEHRKSGTAVTALDTDRPYDWNAKTVADILSREDYIGNTVNCHRAVIQGQA